MKIGFFDSGIGGMTVLHQALRFLPNEDYLFYADTLHVPYGEKPKEEVREYIFNAVDFMANQGIKALVIACNTATSIAVDDLRQKYDFPILGIEPAVKPAVQSCEGKRKKVLVLATNLTLREEKFHNLVKIIYHHDIVESLPLPGLVEFAEKFEFREEIVVPYLREKLGALDLEEYVTVVLGCTHFPYFENSIKKVFTEGVDIISGSIGTAKNLKRILEARNQINDGTGDILFFKSGFKVEEKETLSNYNELLVLLDELQLCHLNFKR
ncbi:glutamate racemase [Bacillus sp. AFS076308]|uniref:glutamate racemase n=1 Tax=unclassified Bacillus (in: firmicutes) TaxID=185979 RepID=UPI000BF50D8E|nr:MULTISPECIES: glutamate racemase [unclassified Bacillus (in: firmicutes)]PFO02317.1 glutamate racemase [Bacillus sp. AFS076308]PGV48693.1 glutamate racemase [Bacillus sp. AFS037270]